MKRKMFILWINALCIADTIKKLVTGKICVMNTQMWLTQPTRRELFRIGTHVYFAHAVVRTWVIASLNNVTVPYTK